jgi:hypothetical protein
LHHANIPKWTSDHDPTHPQSHDHPGGHSRRRSGCGASARTWAAADCWKSTEKDYAKMNVDKRGDIVTKCIDDKMKAAR